MNCNGWINSNICYKDPVHHSVLSGDIEHMDKTFLYLLDAHFTQVWHLCIITHLLRVRHLLTSCFLSLATLSKKAGLTTNITSPDDNNVCMWTVCFILKHQNTTVKNQYSNDYNNIVKPMSVSQFVTLLQTFPITN